MMPTDPSPGNGDRHRIRNDALLLPVSFRYDWQHSSSQLPITHSDARWTSSPSGRYCLRQTHAQPRQSGQTPRHDRPLRSKSGQKILLHDHRHAPHALVPFPSCASTQGSNGLYHSHRSGGDLLLPTSPTGLAALPPPPRLPIDISKARRISSPGGFCFLHRTQPLTHSDLNLCGQKPEIWPEFCRNFRLTCSKRIGAVL
jgi:hypothetical protein